MRFDELFQGIGTAGYVYDGKLSDVTNDTRKVVPGCVFVCIRGENFDGHAHVQKALDAGAAVVVCERSLGLQNQVVVPDTRQAYARLCANFFGNPSRSMKLIGVTGTNGKTTVTNLIKQLLTSAGHKVGLIGTIQNEVGDEVIPAHNTTPEAYELQKLFRRMADAGCDYVSMEVSSHALDQSRVGAVVFDVAVFTNLTQDHLDYHGTFENYFSAKRRLFQMAKKAVINVDDAYGKKLYSSLDYEKRSFSVKDSKSDYFAGDIQCAASGVCYRLLHEKLNETVNFPMPGFFSVYNSMAAVAAVLESGIHPREIADGIQKLHAVKGRSEVIPTGRDFTVICDYAHSPDGLENILPSLKQYVQGRLITVFGCGGDRDRTKRPLMGEAAARHSDYVVITSDNPRSEDPMDIIREIIPGVEQLNTPYLVEPDRRQAIFKAVQMAKKGDVIVLAGKGHEDYQVLKDKTVPMDERIIVGEALKTLQ